MKTTSRFWLVLILTSLITGCGFQLRGYTDIPYSTMYVDGNPNSPLVVNLQRIIRAGGHKERLTASSAQAERTIQILSEINNKIILSLSGAGRVREYQLQYRVKYRLLAPAAKEILLPTEILLTRDMSYNDTDIIAKGSEEQQLYRDMQTDAAQQILRRIALLHGA
ncbi:MAG: lipoprotein B transmembrane [Sulfuriferula sp.]|nr:lipoprotein B transmembrane [Sulfuriferula sp.]